MPEALAQVGGSFAGPATPSQAPPQRDPFYAALQMEQARQQAADTERENRILFPNESDTPRRSRLIPWDEGGNPDLPPGSVGPAIGPAPPSPEFARYLQLLTALGLIGAKRNPATRISIGRE